jgi:hypothetical protein
VDFHGLDSVVNTFLLFGVVGALVRIISDHVRRSEFSNLKQQVERNTELLHELEK